MRADAEVVLNEAGRGVFAELCGMGQTGAHLYHLTTGTLDRREEGCRPGCPFDTTLFGLGDAAPAFIGRHLAAELARDGHNDFRSRITRLVRRWHHLGS
ncbi:hypothetical protein JK361_35180 [Streptomyces sp. 5-8]|uniref:Uncharacterized protein n=1 Tax=Streptomyces musisoli TaxID=2802280 RepID=A0ABS1PBN3_9ACTN|nr:MULTISPECIES: hypothetical protein [Streptomyces]MBL1109761.1 hypothetical protein [Streptomyces musisoli]MBY8846732.1 hypothetical protein [Streptomyces sp. SP2-10]